MSPSKSLHFSHSNTSFLSTSSVELTSSSFIQFEVVVDCGKEKSASLAAKVILQYSTNYGKNWVTLDTGCNPSSTSCSSYRSHVTCSFLTVTLIPIFLFRRNSTYSSGLRSKWSRITLSVTDTRLVALQAVQFRWFASTSNFTMIHLNSY